MSDIFVSYASEDRAKAQTLAQFFESEGWSTFWDRTIPVGMTWDKYIGKELTEARCLVVLWSQASVDSDWVKEEADEGKSRGILIPILIDAVRPPLGFRGIQAGDLSGWDGKQATSEFQRLVSHIARVIGTSPREVKEQKRRKAEEQARHEAEERKQVEEVAKREADAAAKRREQEEVARAEEAARRDKEVARREVVAGHSEARRLKRVAKKQPLGIETPVQVQRPAAESPSLDPTDRPALVLAAAFAVLVVPCQFLLAIAFKVTGSLLAIALAVGAAATLAYRRRARLSGAEIGLYWLGCTLTLLLALALLFAANEWNWVGGTGPPSELGDDARAPATGLLLALVLALSSASVLAYWRRGRLSGIEVGAYWLGCTLALIPALIFLFYAKVWNWVGADHANDGSAATGALIALAIAAASAAVLAYRRRARLSGTEVGAYWLGCTPVLILALGLLSHVHHWNWGRPYVEYWLTGYLAGLTISVASGVVLLVWWRAAQRHDHNSSVDVRTL